MVAEIVIGYIEGVVLLIIALKSDMRRRKIKNIITLPFIIAGLLTNLIFSGYEGLMNSLLGIILPIVLLFALYALRMLGAGDIKLFSALGAIFGVRDVVKIMAYSFVSGGIIAFVLLLLRKNAKERFLHLYNYLKSLLLTLYITPYTEFDRKEDTGRFPFAYAIFCGGLVFIFIEIVSRVQGIALKF